MAGTETTRIRRAMVMAAGFGERMRPLTDTKPKPLIELAGRPLIDHVLDRLGDAGIEMAVVNVHYLADQLETHLAGRTKPEIVISDEREQLLNTGGGLINALPHFGDEPFLAHNSDSAWIEGLGSNLERLISTFDPERMDALLLLAPTISSIGYVGLGDFDLAPDGQITRRGEAMVAPFIWTGVQIVHPPFFEGAPDGPFSTNLLWDKAIERERLFGIRLSGTWMHVGRPEDLHDAEEFLAAL